MSEWTLAAIRDRKLEQEAYALYGGAMPYHNFDHVLSTLHAGEHIIRRCMDEGIRVDGLVVYYAILFHDAGYQENHRSLGFETKEGYSAELARQVLQRWKIPSRIVQKVASAILSTQREAAFVTVEQKVVRAADLSGLASEYPVFRDQAERLRLEHAMVFGEALAWREWVPRVAETVRFYLAQEIRLTSFFVNEDGDSAFHHAVRGNLKRLLAEI